jgi:hypothetical protein
MKELSYPPARLAALKVEEHFEEHIGSLQLQDLVHKPDAERIESIINAAFWASLRREEGYDPKISLALLPPEDAGEPLSFGQWLPLSPSVLRKLAPAVERPGIHLGVWHKGGELFVWGTTRVIPMYCFVLEVIEPGLLVVKYRRSQESSKYINVLVIMGDQIKVVDEEVSRLPDCPSLVTMLLDFHSSTHRDSPVNVLLQLAVSMRAHGRGGSLLIVPDGSEQWRESIVQPVLYSLDPPFSELRELMQKDEKERGDQHWQDSLNSVVEEIAGLTAVDGATVITNRYDLLLFGAKIRRRKGAGILEQVMFTEPIVGKETLTIHPLQLGGTRHLSAAQFVHDQRDSMALVSSQDGQFTVFVWSECERKVHAHRVETLLL